MSSVVVAAPRIASRDPGNAQHLDLLRLYVDEEDSAHTFDFGSHEEEPLRLIEELCPGIGVAVPPEATELRLIIWVCLAPVNDCRRAGFFFLLLWPVHHLELIVR